MVGSVKITSSRFRATVRRIHERISAEIFQKFIDPELKIPVAS